MMPKKIITRFAPSPTGSLHVGSLRTALYNYLFAKKNQGNFLLRIEDTDQERKVEGASENLKIILKQFGLTWDNKKVMVQSERLKEYQQAAQELIKKEKAYYCFCSKERLDNLRKVQQQKGLPPMYDGCCRDLPAAETKAKLTAKTPYVIRFKIPRTGQTEFTDLIRGQVTFDNKLLDDPIILKSDGFPAYHLASVVDDHDMATTHVFRGEEWLPSTPKHILLYQAFGWQPPEFAHLPLLLNPDRSKLSKRQGDVAVEDFLKKGYLPEALLNFVLLLGWNPGTDQEIFSNLEEMAKAFDLEKVNKSGAVFDTQKLDWLNGQYIRQKPLPELAKLCQPFFAEVGIKADLKSLEKIVATEHERIKKLSDIVPVTEFFFKEPTYEPKLLIWKKIDKNQTADNLKILKEFLENLAEKKWQKKDLEEEIIGLIKEKGRGVGDMLWPMRVALSGRQASPGPFEIAEVLGKTESLKRIQKAIDLLK
ncbi:MAG: glutamate--tRNA ligase [Patescibacteria group bacterium]|jgi:glutamyl-tRNA synthetase